MQGLISLHNLRLKDDGLKSEEGWAIMVAVALFIHRYSENPMTNNLTLIAFVLDILRNN